MAIIDVDDLPQSVRDAFEPGELGMIVSGMNARALRVAPCLAEGDPTGEVVAEARLILLGALKRWAQAGAGALSQRSRTAGPFSDSESYDTRQRSGYNLWPTEITDLQGLCAGDGSSSDAFSVDTVPGVQSSHLDICNLNFGGIRCSCGANIAGRPIYEWPDVVA